MQMTNLEYIHKNCWNFRDYGQTKWWCERKQGWTICSSGHSYVVKSAYERSVCKTQYWSAALLPISRIHGKGALLWRVSDQTITASKDYKFFD